MTHSKLAILPVFLVMAACSSVPRWSPSSSNRELGVARVSYEYAKFAEPTMSDTEAVQLAERRCASWGFTQAEMIPGELRNCSVKDGDGCDQWKVVREYRCSNPVAYPRAAAR